jgi:hypothetical protein
LTEEPVGIRPVVTFRLILRSAVAALAGSVVTSAPASFAAPSLKQYVLTARDVPAGLLLAREYPVSLTEAAERTADAVFGSLDGRRGRAGYPLVLLDYKSAGYESGYEADFTETGKLTTSSQGERLVESVVSEYLLSSTAHAIFFAPRAIRPAG